MWGWVDKVKGRTGHDLSGHDAKLVPYSEWMYLLGRLERGCSSGVEHLTADQEVSGSNPDAPCFMSNLNTFLHTSADTVSS